MIKKCLQCDKEFKVANWDADRKFCSKKCSEEYLDIHNRVVKKCKICGEDFKCNKTMAEWKVCCSVKCSNELKDKIKRESEEIRRCVVCEKEFKISQSIIKICCSPVCNKKWSLRFKVKENCVICGKEKWVAPSMHKTDNPICSSKECKRKQLQQMREGEGNPNFKGVVRKIPCIVCGTVTKDYSNNKRFCSKKCKDKWQEENLKGEKNPFYGKHHTEEAKRLSSERNSKGEWKNINRAIRGTGKMAKWKKDVFEKYDYTCQDCGERSRKGRHVYLNAHHKIPLAKLMENYKDIEEKFNKDSYSVLHDDYFYDVENSECLCVDCHKLRHMKGGGG